MRGSRWLTMAVVGMAGVLLGGTAQAGAQRARAPAGEASKQAAREKAGTVEKIDLARSELTLAGSGEKLKVTDRADVLKFGQRATFSDVQEGDEVRASYSRSGGELRVNKLEIVRSEEPFHHPSHDGP